MGSCLCGFGGNEADTESREPNERSRLLSDPVTEDFETSVDQHEDDTEYDERNRKEELVAKIIADTSDALVDLSVVANNSNTSDKSTLVMADDQKQRRLMYQRKLSQFSLQGGGSNTLPKMTVRNASPVKDANGNSETLQDVEPKDELEVAVKRISLDLTKFRESGNDLIGELPKFQI